MSLPETNTPPAARCAGRSWELIARDGGRRQARGTAIRDRWLIGVRLNELERRIDYGYSCQTVDLNNVARLWNIFAGLHIYCGAWEDMSDGTRPRPRRTYREIVSNP